MKYCSKCGTRMDDSLVVCPKCQNRSGSRNQSGHSAQSDETSPRASTKQRGRFRLILPILLIPAIVGFYLCVETIPRWRKASRRTVERQSFEVEKSRLANMTQDELEQGVRSRDAKCLHESSRRIWDAAVSAGSISTDLFDTAFAYSLAAAEEASEKSFGISWNIEIRSLLDLWRQAARDKPDSIYFRDKNFAKRVNGVLKISEDSPFYIRPDATESGGKPPAQSQMRYSGNGGRPYGDVNPQSQDSRRTIRPEAKPMD